MKTNIVIWAKNIHTGKSLIVDEISMGQSSTSIYFRDVRESGNSIDYEFYHQGRKIDIFKSTAFNPYLSKGDLIHYDL